MVSSEILDGPSDTEHCSIAAALARGGVRHDALRSDLQAMLRGLADAMPIGVGSGEGWANRLLSGDGFEPEFTRDRAAVLCADRPILLPAIEATVWLFSLTVPLEPGRGGPAIDRVFLILSPTVTDHETLRGRLRELMELPAFLTLLETPETVNDLIARIRALESTLPPAGH